MDNSREMLKAIRMQSEMLTQIGDSQARIEMKQDSIILAIDRLATTIGEFCENISKMLTSSQEKEQGQ